MSGFRRKTHDHKDHLVQGGALCLLLLLTGLGIAGPSGLLSWREQEHLLEQRKQQIASLNAERDILENRVKLLDPKNTDPDLVSELLRRDQNVIHPDEIVVALPNAE